MASDSISTGNIDDFDVSTESEMQDFPSESESKKKTPKKEKEKKSKKNRDKDEEKEYRRPSLSRLSDIHSNRPTFVRTSSEKRLSAKKGKIEDKKVVVTLNPLIGSQPINLNKKNDEKKTTSSSPNSSTIPSLDINFKRERSNTLGKDNSPVKPSKSDAFPGIPLNMRKLSNNTIISQNPKTYRR